MGVSKALRFEVLRRDRFTCTYCGAKAPNVELHVDHITPESLGGTNTPSNLTTACVDCNSGKSSRMVDDGLIDPVDERARRWASAMEQAINERRSSEDYKRQVAVYFMHRWDEWTPPAEVEDDYAETIVRFLSFGLDWDTIEDLIAVAMRSRARSKWKYFCGCCNRRIDDLRKRAFEIVEEDDG